VPSKDFTTEDTESTEKTAAREKQRGAKLRVPVQHDFQYFVCCVVDVVRRSPPSPGECIDRDMGLYLP
jgi:hypothetical protein